jgi:DNA-binding NtrC family response regulator
MELQSDLLLLVEEAGKVETGKNAGTHCRVRFIATSEHPIETLVHRGTFRKDLYYRLNVIPLFLLPLRHRRADIPLLMDYFIIDACVKNNKSLVIPSQKAREMLYVYHWPGNVDELSTFMHRIAKDGNESCIVNNSNIQKSMKYSGGHLLKAASVEELPKAYEIKDFIPTAKSLSLRSICDEFVSRTERRLMRRALDSTNWNRKKAAELLNISYKSMLNKMKAYDII